MLRLDESQRDWLEEICHHYEVAAVDSPAASYLNGRGLSLSELAPFRLGLVDDPPPEHRQYQGRLAIPIIKKSGVVSFKFRCISGHDCKAAACAKYLSDGPQYLYNVPALDDPTEVLDLTEGEPDTWTLASVMNLSSVAIPGTETLKRHPEWLLLLKGYKRVRFWADNDPAGNKLAAFLKEAVPNLDIIHLDEGMDVNSTYMEYGPLHLAELAGG